MPSKNPTLIDTHCHLDFESFDRDRSQVLDNAAQVGVKLIIDPGIDLESSRKSVALAQTHPQMYAAVGVHPNEAESWDSDTLTELERLEANRKVIAIGEIGLDYYREGAPREKQIRVLEQQLDLAEKINLPVILHNRESSADLLDILRTWVGGLQTRGAELAARPGVLHSFSGDIQLAEQALQMNFLIGITGPVTYPNARELRSLIPKIPLDYILVETDSPFLSPQPKRGKRNEPGNVRYVAEKIAELHQIPFEVVANSTSANAQMLFQIGEKSFA